MEELNKKQEEETKEEDKAEETKPTSVIGSAHEAAERLKLENERMEKNLSQLQELRADRILSGETDAGQAPEKKEELSDTEYANKALNNELPKNE